MTFRKNLDIHGEEWTNTHCEISRRWTKEQWFNLMNEGCEHQHINLKNNVKECTAQSYNILYISFRKCQILFGVCMLRNYWKGRMKNSKTGKWLYSVEDWGKDFWGVSNRVVPGLRKTCQDLANLGGGQVSVLEYVCVGKDGSMAQRNCGGQLWVSIWLDQEAPWMSGEHILGVLMSTRREKSN